MPIAVQVERARWLEDAVQLDHSLLHPVHVDVNATLPAVLEGPHLGLVAPDHFVLAVREEGRVQVDEIDALGRELAEPVQVVIAIDDASLKE